MIQFSLGLHPRVQGDSVTTSLSEYMALSMKATCMHAEVLMIFIALSVF
jgi:hypothetical protein